VHISVISHRIFPRLVVSLLVFRNSTPTRYDTSDCFSASTLYDFIPSRDRATSSWSSGHLSGTADRLWLPSTERNESLYSKYYCEISPISLHLARLELWEISRINEVELLLIQLNKRLAVHDNSLESIWGIPATRGNIPKSQYKAITLEILLQASKESDLAWKVGILIL
jgi:hypothetical protein